MLERRPLEREVTVAVRKSEEVGDMDDGSAHGLIIQRTDVADVDVLANQCPDRFVWREARRPSGATLGL